MMERALLMSPKERNTSRDGLIKIGWVVYSLLFPYIFSLSLIIVNALFCSDTVLPIKCKVYNNFFQLHHNFLNNFAKFFTKKHCTKFCLKYASIIS